jgi:hypothetical protein
MRIVLVALAGMREMAAELARRSVTLIVTGAQPASLAGRERASEQ